MTALTVLSLVTAHRPIAKWSSMIVALLGKNVIAMKKDVPLSAVPVDSVLATLMDALPFVLLTLLAAVAAKDVVFYVPKAREIVAALGRVVKRFP